MKRLILLLTTLTACRTPAVCTPGHTRCDDQIVQICDADGHFQPMMDCRAVSERMGRNFSCQLIDSPADDELEWEGADGYTCEVERDAVAQ